MNVKTNRSSVSRQSSKRHSNLDPPGDHQSGVITTKEENFVTDFLKFCKDSDVHPLPEFHIIGVAERWKITSTISENLIQSNEEPKNKPESESITTFTLNYENSVALDSPKDLRCRGFQVNIFMLDALNNCLKKFTTITTLKLQRCSINAFGIVQISEILSEKSGSSITDLNLDVNPNIKQNYHLLCAPGSSLLYLSLKLCEINDEGVARIASNLSYRDEPDTPKLIALNLANNHVSEIGCKAIGCMLRTNRSLQSLTLTGNRINDAGAEYILEQLSTFTLTHDEVVAKRRRKLNRLKLCGDQMDECLSQLETSKIEIEGIKEKKSLGVENRVVKKRRASSRQVISHNSSESSANKSNPAIIIAQSLEEKTEGMIPADAHPLVRDVIAVNGTLTCPGNLKLQHLNLSFNKIGEDTLRRIISCLEEQSSVIHSTSIINNDTNNQGLRHVNVEGNEFETSCELALQLFTLLNHTRTKP